MQAVKKTIHIILALAIISMGLPLYHPGDANRDGEVGLADAILRMQGFVQNVENPADFRKGMADVLLTISSVAGFKKMIKADREAGNQPDSLQSPVPAVNSGLKLEIAATIAAPGADQSFIYSSPALTPLIPPPRFFNA